MPLQVNPDGVPLELRQLDQWVCWRYVAKKDNKGQTRWAKVPVNARTGRNARSNDPGTWAPFAEAMAYLHSGAADGIGFMFSEKDPFAGVDLDDCRDPATGFLDPWAADEVRALATYAEVSPTGTGVKTILKGVLHPDARNKVPPFEFYDRDRFFALTGMRLEDAPTALEDRQAAFDALYQKALADHEKARRAKAEADKANRVKVNGRARGAKPRANGRGNGHTGSIFDQTVTSGCPFDYHDDDALIEHMKGAENGDKFSRLWRGDAGDHDGDESRRDAALCTILAWWTGKNRDRIDRLFRRSGCMRDKWDEPRRETTYGGLTLDFALSCCEGKYDPAKPNLRTQSDLLAAEPDTGEGQAIEGQPTRGYYIILRHFRERYQPTFRRGTSVFSGILGREVRQGEACTLTGYALITALAKATDAPRCRGGGSVVDTNALPNFFRTWAPIAWADLLESVEEEAATSEIDGNAQERFLCRLRGALVAMVALGASYDKNNPGERTDTQRRSLIGWLRLFAKANRWADVRGYFAWSRSAPPEATGGTPRLRVAIRVELFQQLHYAPLAVMSQEDFRRMCELYGVGTQVKVKGGKARAVELTHEFLADLLAAPVDDQDSRTDGQETHAGACERPSVCPSEA
jgi:hypothetical protein